ncbi:tetratricopeptide repeat protein, partial [Candidatus Parcubacteria bacterium]
MIKSVQLLRFSLGLMLLVAVEILMPGCGSNATPRSEMAITTKSDDARSVFITARELFENIRFDEARGQFERAIEKDPEFALAHLYRAFTATSATDFQTHLQHAVQLAPNITEGERLLIQSVQANADNNAVLAVELGEKLEQRFPEDKRVHQFLGNAYTGQNNYNKAIAQFQKAVEIDKDYAPAYNSLGYAYMNSGQFQEAERAFKHYIQLIPEEGNPHDSLADLYTKMGNHEAAIEHYEKALSLNPKFAFSQRKIGTNLVFMGNYEDGRKAYLTALDMEVTPTARITDMNQVAYSYLYQSDPQEALRHFDKSIVMAADASLPERVAGIHVQKCNVNIEVGDLKAAEKSLAQCRRAVATSNLSPSLKDNFEKTALFQEALIAAKGQDFERAMSTAGRLLSKIQADNNPTEMKQYQELLGHIAYLKGDYPTAITH